MKISDELRELAGEAGIYSNACGALRELADRIDRETVELPKDRDGVPIHMGDEVWTTFNHQANVIRICILRESAFVLCEYPNEEKAFLKPYDLTHEYPDSLERIADELEAAKGWRDQNGEHSCIVSSVSTKTLQEWADRIRKMAEKEEENGN